MHSKKNSKHIKIYIIVFVILLIMVNLTDDKNEHIDEVVLANMATMINSGTIASAGNITATGDITGKSLTAKNGS